MLFVHEILQEPKFFLSCLMLQNFRIFEFCFKVFFSMCCSPGCSTPGSSHTFPFRYELVVLMSHEIEVVQMCILSYSTMFAMP